MKDYRNSDYALNKFSRGIVYRFTDCIVEITLEDYLVANPGKTAQDFFELKVLSDEIYHQQVIDDNRTSRLNVSIDELGDTVYLAAPSLDLELIHRNDIVKAVEATRRLLNSKELTETQRRRFILHFIKGLSYRQIACLEQVHFTSVHESIKAAASKLQKLFEKL